MGVYDTINKTVPCPSCGFPAFLKETKTHHIMLRCNNCQVLIFANGPVSARWLIGLPAFS